MLFIAVLINTLTLNLGVLTVIVTGQEKTAAAEELCQFALLWLTCLCTARDLSPTVVLLCELLIGVCGAGLGYRKVRVLGGAVQHQRPLLQLA